MATLAEQASKLLDFNQKLDITLLDNIVGCMYTGIGEQQRVAQEVLTTLKEHPNAWTRVDTILEYSQVNVRMVIFLIVGPHIYVFASISISSHRCTESTNKILRLANIGASYKDTMESTTEKSMRRYKKVYRRPYHKDEQRSRDDGIFQSLSQQTQYDPRASE